MSNDISTFVLIVSYVDSGFAAICVVEGKAKRIYQIVYVFFCFLCCQVLLCLSVNFEITHVLMDVINI